jgi:hypothetical protein
MNIDFYKGTLRLRDGGAVPFCWAETPHGTMAFSGESMEPTDLPPETAIISADLITSVDLSGLDRSGIETIVRNIVQGGYLDKPGVRNKGEAVLFVLVNEAIHGLSEMSDEDLDE